MGLWISLLRVNEVGELGRVSDEEDWGVVEDPVKVALVCPDLDGEPTGITGSVGRTRLASDGGETDGGACLHASFAEEGRGCDVAETVGYLEVAVSTGAFGVDLADVSDVL